MLTMSTTIHGTILHSAVASGAEDVFKVVLSTLKETLAPEQVRSVAAHAPTPLLDAFAPLGYQKSSAFLSPTESAAMPRTMNCWYGFGTFADHLLHSCSRFVGHVFLGLLALVTVVNLCLRGGCTLSSARNHDQSRSARTRSACVCAACSIA